MSRWTTAQDCRFLIVVGAIVFKFIAASTVEPSTLELYWLFERILRRQVVTQTVMYWQFTYRCTWSHIMQSFIKNFGGINIKQ